MTNSAINNILEKSAECRKIPKRVLILIGLAYITPVLKELLFYDWVEWLWLLYMIPGLFLAYYHGLKGAIVNVIISGCFIGIVELYQYQVHNKNEVIHMIKNMHLGTIMAMTFTSFIVALLAKKLQLVRTSLALLLDNMNSYIIVLDTDQKIIYANAMVAQLRGLPISQMVGLSWSDFHPAPRTGKIITDTLDTGKSVLNHEVTFSMGGEQKHFAVDNYCLKSDRAEIMGALLSLRDITEKKQLENKTQQSERFNALGELAAGLAHEIRNPLTSITGYLQLLEKKNKVTNQEHSNIMLEELAKINKLLTEFLVLAKPIPSKMELCYIEEVLEDVLGFMNCEALLYDIEINKLIAPPSRKVNIDIELIKQALINILQNAIEAMPKGGTLSVSCSLSRNQRVVILKIKDTGDGIAARDINNIYNPFFTTKEEGTGLGLSVSYKIIEDHFGNLNIESTKNRGTTATIILPVVAEEI